MRALSLAIAVLLAACGAAPAGSIPSPSATRSPSPTAPATVSAAASVAPDVDPSAIALIEFPVGRGQGPHDVAPAADGGVWYTAQASGQLGGLDSKTGATKMVDLGRGSAPHGVIVGPDGAPWITAGGINAIVRVDPRSSEITTFKLPGPNVNLNTATFDRSGILWFTGQNGFYGRVDPKSGEVKVFSAPRGPGPYGITATPSGDVYYASLAGNHIAKIDLASGTATPIDPPTARQGARRVWSDSRGRIWVSEWNVGQLGMYDPAARAWKEWKLPGANPMAYAVFVDDRDIVWMTDWGANAIVRFDPATEKFAAYPHSAPNANVREILGRGGELWGAMSGQDKLVVARAR
jgi:virginiamycin B lyase